MKNSIKDYYKYWISKHKIVVVFYIIGLIACAILFGLAYAAWWIGIISYLCSTYFAYSCVR